MASTTGISVLAIDPGLRTGWAMWSPGKFRAGICDPEDVWDLLDRWTNEWTPVPALGGGVRRRGCLVMESYTITGETARKSQQPWSLELIGCGRMLAGQRGQDFALQAPSAAKKFGTDYKLKLLDMYTPGREDHARDASRHLLLHLVKAGLLDIGGVA